MISVREAIDIVLKNTNRRAPVSLPVAEAVGRVLAEDVRSDIDMPPFHRSMMDGYAVRSEDVRTTPAVLHVVGFIPAGAYPGFALGRGEAAKIMTGAPLPEGADAVREVEKTEPGRNDTEVRILESVQPGQNVVRAASEVAKNDVILTSGTYLSPAAIGILAATGHTHVKVYAAPRVAMLATGNELVEPSVVPMQGQIRNSNSASLQAQCRALGLECDLLGIAKDDKTALKQRIQRGLNYDVLLITGGVSMGDLDFVDDVFRELGLRILFEKVAIKPGKPTVFALHENRPVFGLPGNPVSGATVFEVIVRPALRKMMGYPTWQNQIVRAQLTRMFRNKSGRENYHPSVTWYEEGRFFCRPLETRGSGDVASYAHCNSYLICPQAQKELPEGAEIDVMLRDDYYMT